MSKRVFLIVLDSFGIGECPDSYKWHDEGSNTLGAIRKHPAFDCPNLEKLGLFAIDGVEPTGNHVEPIGAYGRMTEASQGKDTTIGHWEIAGIISPEPLPTFPEGFPKEVLDEFTRLTGREVLCNRPYSGTDVIRDFGEEHMKTGKLIVYTSADSVFQIAAHEDVVPVEELYRICDIARKMLTGKYGVGRVIARPFEGEWPFKRTTRRHDYSLVPPAATMLDVIKKNGLDCISVGKIADIFANQGLTEGHRTTGNTNGMEVTAAIAGRDFHGLCFTNLVDFDMLYGHRNNVEGYAAAMTEFDRWLTGFLPTLGEDDVLMITADHGCDPSTPSTDHSREYTPWIVYGPSVKPGSLGTHPTFADIAATVLDYLGLPTDEIAGTSYWPACRK